MAIRLRILSNGREAATLQMATMMLYAAACRCAGASSKPKLRAQRVSSLGTCDVIARRFA
jgi:hypothetical protein